MDTREHTINYLSEAGWTPEPDKDHAERIRWTHHSGEVAVIPSVEEWPRDRLAHGEALRRITAADRVNHQTVTGAVPYDPSGNLLLHMNGEGRKHEAAFRDAPEDDQVRHLRRQHFADDVQTYRETATDPGQPLASLSEAHEWWHYRDR